MRTVSPQTERLRYVLDYDQKTGVFTWKNPPGDKMKPGDTAGVRDNTGYIRIRFDNVLYMAHRLAWQYIHGSPPLNVLDHKNRVRNDNKISNLRQANQT